MAQSLNINKKHKARTKKAILNKEQEFPKQTLINTLSSKALRTLK
jgi:hypothetical protein